MAMAGPLKFVPGLPILLTLLDATVQEGTHSLCYNFTINLAPRSGRHWCRVQGQMDQKAFMAFDCVGDKAISMNVLGGKVNATKAWEDQMERLKDIGNLLKEKLLDTKLENSTTRDPLTLQGRMMCQHKANAPPSGSWEFTVNGQISFCFDANHERWTEISSGSSYMKEKWEKDKEVTRFLYMTSMGDCNMWLKEFQKYCKEVPDPTVITSATLELVLSRSVSNTSSPWLLLVILTCFILVLQGDRTFTPSPKWRSLDF